MTPMVGIYRRRCRSGRAACGRRGFTLIELMVSVAIMVVMLLAVGKIFKMSSDASGLVIAHTEVLERLQTIARVMEADLRNIRPGLLIIDSRTGPHGHHSQPFFQYCQPTRPVSI